MKMKSPRTILTLIIALGSALVQPVNAVSSGASRITVAEYRPDDKAMGKAHARTEGHAYAVNKGELYTVEADAPGDGQTLPAASPSGPPAVQVTSPLMNADVGAGADIVLTAAASGTVAKIEFFDDDVLVGTVVQAPFTFAYHPAAPKLNFRITARITDTASHTAVSSPVTCVASSQISCLLRTRYGRPGENSDV